MRLSAQAHFLPMCYNLQTWYVCVYMIRMLITQSWKNLFEYPPCLRISLLLEGKGIWVCACVCIFCSQPSATHMAAHLLNVCWRDLGKSYEEMLTAFWKSLYDLQTSCTVCSDKKKFLFSQSFHLNSCHLHDLLHWDGQFSDKHFLNVQLGITKKKT